jgi:hypothetical protein
MIDTVPRPDATLPEFLAARARHASDARLVAYACGGFVLLIVALVWRGSAWHVLVSLAMCVLTFGVWGIADRELGERSGGNVSTRTLVMLRVVRVIAATLGAAAFVALLVSAMAIALGRMIS